MYLNYFGFRERPFRLTPDPRFLYLSEKHTEALDHLYYGITQGEGFMVITGDVGTGKTTIIRSLLDRLNDPNIQTAIILNPLLEIEDLLKTIVEDFGLSPLGTSKKGLVDQLNTFLLSLNQNGRKVVVIIDEAQNLSPELLEELRSLSNLETDKEKLLQIVLVGQLELWDKLNSPDLKQLKQRISVTYRLEALSLQEMKGYIAHRITTAGSDKDVAFTVSAFWLIYRVSRGVPRLINLICDRTLLVLYTEQKKVGSLGQVRKALKSLNGGKDRFWVSWKKNLQGLVLIGAGCLLSSGIIFNFWDFPKGKTGLEATEISGELPHSSLPARYSVHISSFKKKRLADQTVEKIRLQGLEAYQTTVDLPGAGTWYRIFVGQYETKEEALNLANRLKGAGLFPFSMVTSLPRGNVPVKKDIKESKP